MASRVMGPIRGWFIVTGPYVTGAVAAMWFLLIFRAIPVPIGDYGMFVTVAERLRAGDRLYADVYENKDPLFHYTLALTRSISPYAGWFLELAWLVVASWACYLIARKAGTSQSMAVFVGFAATPFIITGSAWVAGGSHLPGVALCLVIAAAAVRHKYWLVGLLLGPLAFFKLVMLPVGLSIFIVAAIVRGRRLDFVHGVIGACGSIMVVVALMTARGELSPYLQGLLESSNYANNAQSSHGLAGILEHLTRVLTVNNQVILITSITSLFLVLMIRPRILASRLDETGTTLAWLVFATSAAGLLAVAFTGLWPHHGLIFIVPAVLALTLLVARGPQEPRAVTITGFAALLGISILLAGVPDPRLTIDELLYARAVIWEQTAVPPETALILSSGPPTTFARIGGGNDGGFARGLEDWTLSCRRFGQSQLDPAPVLQETVDCIPKAQIVLVAHDATPTEGATNWNSFLTSVEMVLSRDFECSTFDAGRLCVRLPATAPTT